MVVLVALSPKWFAVAEFFSHNDYEGRSTQPLEVMHRESENRAIFLLLKKDKKLTKFFFSQNVNNNDFVL